MYSFKIQNAFIVFLKYTGVLGFIIFYSVQEHETNVWLILKEVLRCVFSLDILFRDFLHEHFV